MSSTGSIYQTFIAHSIDTPEKFEAKRAELAEREWARMKENNSATCRSCHNYDAMDHAKQHPEAARQRKITPLEEKVFIAAALAHNQTGRPISTHTSFSTMGLEQLALLQAHGVDLSRVTVGHCDLKDNLDNILNSPVMYRCPSCHPICHRH